MDLGVGSGLRDHASTDARKYSGTSSDMDCQFRIRFSRHVCTGASASGWVGTNEFAERDAASCPTCLACTERRKHVQHKEVVPQLF